MRFFDAHYDMGGVVSVKADWIHPERTVDFNEIIYVVKGNVKLFEDEKKYELKSGDCIVLEKGKHHGGYEKNVKEAQFYWFHFYSDYKEFGAMKHTSLADSDIAPTLAHKLAYESGTITSPEEVRDNYVRLLLNEAYIASLQSTATAYPLCGTIAEWITQNSSKKIDVEDVSQKFGYNKDYISRAFKRGYGMSLKSYIDTERMKYIKGLLLTTGYPLKQVALLAGFTDYKSFLKFFAYHSNETPLEFRQKYVN